MTTVSPAAVTTATATRVRTARPRAILVHGSAILLFAGVAGLLGIRMEAGQDPALGEGYHPVAAAPARPVLVRRVIVTRRVEEVAAAPTAGAAPAGTSGAAAATAAGAAPGGGAAAPAAATQRAAAPASASAPPAPTNTAAPAPAAEPAPVTTTTAPAAAPAAPAPVATATS